MKMVFRWFGKNHDYILGPLKFLLDYKQSGFITGIVLPIDGGFLA